MIFVLIFLFFFVFDYWRKYKDKYGTDEGFGELVTIDVLILVLAICLSESSVGISMFIGIVWFAYFILREK